MDRTKAINGVTGARIMQEGAAGSPPPPKPQEAGQGATYVRSDGTRVPMASMNPHHRAAAARKADLAGNKELAQALRASGTIPE